MPSPFIRAFPECLYFLECCIPIAGHDEGAEDQTGVTCYYPYSCREFISEVTVLVYAKIQKAVFFPTSTMFPSQMVTHFYHSKNKEMPTCEKQIIAAVRSFFLRCLHIKYIQHCNAWHGMNLWCVSNCTGAERPCAGKGTWGCASHVLSCPYLEKLWPENIHLYTYGVNVHYLNRLFRF